MIVHYLAAVNGASDVVKVSNFKSVALFIKAQQLMLAVTEAASHVKLC